MPESLNPNIPGQPQAIAVPNAQNQTGAAPSEERTAEVFNAVTGKFERVARAGLPEGQAQVIESATGVIRQAGVPPAPIPQPSPGIRPPAGGPEAQIRNVQGFTPQEMSRYAEQVQAQRLTAERENEINRRAAAAPPGTAYDPATGAYKDIRSGAYYAGAKVGTSPSGQEILQAQPGGLGPDVGLRFTSDIAQAVRLPIPPEIKPVLSPDIKQSVERGLYGDVDTGILSTEQYTLARGQLDSAIKTAEKSPLDLILGESEQYARAVIQANLEEYNRLKGFGEGKGVDPVLALLTERAGHIAAQMQAAVGDIHNQAEQALIDQDKLNRELMGKARAAVNAAGMVGSMVGEGYLAAQMQNNLNALQSIKWSEQKAINDARQHFLDRQDELAFKQVEVIEKRREEARNLLLQNFQIGQQIEAVKMQRAEFQLKVNNAATDTEVKKLQLNGLREEAAQKKIENIIASGIEINEHTFPAFQKAVEATGSNWGAAEIYGFAKIAKNQWQGKEAERAEKLVGLLAKTRTGGTISIAGQSYAITGTDASDVKSGVQIDESTGQGYGWTFDPSTKKFTSTPMGQLGSPKNNWSIIQDENGVPWNVNSMTNERKMLNLTDGQKFMDGAFPTGSVGTPYRADDDPYQGQCGAALNDIYDPKMGKVWGSSFEEKTQTLQKLGTIPIEQVQTNDTLVIRNGSTGHVALVNGVFNDHGITKVRLSESNFRGDKKWTHDREIALNDSSIVGATRIPLRSELIVGPDAAPREPIRSYADYAAEWGVQAGGSVGLDIPSYEEFSLDLAETRPGPIEPQITEDLYKQTVGRMQPMMNAVSYLATRMPKEQGKLAINSVQSALSAGDIIGAQEKLKGLAITSVTGEEQQRVRGREVGLKQLGGIRDLLAEYEKVNPGGTNIFRGTEEQIARRVGLVVVPEHRKLASQISSALIDYRKSVSGAAFTESEGKQYAALMPDIKNTYDLNIALIDGLLSSWESGQEAFYETVMTPSIYEAIYR